MIVFLTIVSVIAVLAIAGLLFLHFDPGFGVGFGVIGSFIVGVASTIASADDTVTARQGHEACATMNAPCAGNFNREQWCYGNASSMFKVDAP